MNRFLMVLAAVVVFVLVGGLSAAAPKSPPPSIVVIDEVDKDRQLLTVVTYAFVTVQKDVKRTVKGPDGDLREVVETVTEMRPVARVETVEGKGLQVLDVKGEKLAAADAWDRLKPGQAVLVSDSPTVDPVYRKLLAKDALILVVPMPVPEPGEPLPIGAPKGGKAPIKSPKGGNGKKLPPADDEKR